MPVFKSAAFRLRLATADKPRNLRSNELRHRHIAVPAADPVALKNWYERVLGAREIFNNGKTPPTLLIALPGGGWLEIYAADAPLPERGNNKLAGFRPHRVARGFD